MTEFLSPGIFIAEKKSQQQSINGVSTSNFATVGWTQKGIENKAILVGSLREFFRKFGTFWKNSDLPLAVTAFFQNGGARAYIVRVTPEDAVAASGSMSGLWTLNAISKGTWGNQARLVVKGNNNYYDTATATYSRFDLEVQEESADGANDWSVSESYDAVSLSDSDSADYLPLVINDTESGSDLIQVVEVSGGIPSAFASQSVSGEYLVSGTGAGSQLIAASLLNVPVAKHTMKLTVDGTVIATDDGKGKFKIASGSGFTSVVGTINYTTGAISVTVTPGPSSGAEVAANYYKAGATSVAYELSGGVDGTEVTRSEVTDPQLALEYKGIYALDMVDEILNIGLPDFPGDSVIHQDLIAYCEGRKDCFAILDTEFGIDPQDAINYKTLTLGSVSNYAAIYYPQVKVADPLLNGKSRVISCVGHVAGVFARTDNDRNVAKAPAGQIEGRLNFVVDTERLLSKADRDILYPRNINIMRSDAIVGRCVWGSRTLETVGDFTQVPHRRLFQFLEKSIFNSTHDLVFEPITEALFNTINLRLDSFLGVLTGLNYFASNNPSEAYRIVVDSSNNTADTIKSRLVIVDILVAVQNPAEFILFRFERSLETLS